MNSCGTLSPWITPRTVRPFCRNGVSNDTSVPARALPSSTQVPAGISASTASRNTDGKRRGLQREARAKAGDLADFGHHVGAAAVIDGVRGAEFARQRQPMLVHVDRDDRIAAGDLGRHQAGQADRADAEHREAVARRAASSH